MILTIKIFLGFVGITALSIATFHAVPEAKYYFYNDLYEMFAHRIFSPTPAVVDTVFLGSSRTSIDIDDEKINAALPGQTSWNFGSIRESTGFRYLILRDLMKRKTVKSVVVEMPFKPELQIHPYFEKLATVADAAKLTRLVLASRNFISYYQPTPEQREMNQQLLSLWLSFPFRGLHGLGTMFAYSVYRRWNPLGKVERGLPPADKPPIVAGPRIATAPFPELNELTWRGLEDITSLCKENGAKLFFLFLPDQGDPEPDARTLSRFVALGGETIVLESSRYFSPELWADKRHLNHQGTKVFTSLLMQSPLYAPHAAQVKRALASP